MQAYDGIEDMLVVRNNVIISEDVFRVYVYLITASIHAVHARRFVKFLPGQKHRITPCPHPSHDVGSSDNSDGASLSMWGAYRYLNQFVRGYKPMALYYQDLEFKYEHCEGNKLCSLTTFRKGTTWAYTQC